MTRKKWRSLYPFVPLFKPIPSGTILTVNKKIEELKQKRTLRPYLKILLEMKTEIGKYAVENKAVKHFKDCIGESSPPPSCGRILFMIGRICIYMN